MDYAIRVTDLQKSYGNKAVLRGISLKVKQGGIFALLGTNGAGKTTTLECIEGLRKYDGGSIEVNGRRGVQLQSTSLPPNLKAVEAIRYFSKWQRTSWDEKLPERLGVAPFLNRQYGQLSTGQKRRLHLMIALLGDPDILFLDEPTAGLDVEGRVGIHDEIKRLKASGKTIVLASHDMAEVEELCDQIAILRDGEIAFTGTPAQMARSIHGDYWLKIRFSDTLSPELFRCEAEPAAEQGYYTLHTTSIEEALADILRVTASQSVSIRDMKVGQTDIERRFLEIAKEGR